MRSPIRFLTVILLVSIYSCKKNEDINNNKSLFGSNNQTITLERIPQMGFCISENKIITGTLSIKSDGAIIQGTKAVVSSSDRNNCLETYNVHPCLTEVAFGPIKIEQNQLDEIQKLVAQIPEWECNYNGACDPCLLTKITINDVQARDVTCCDNVNENYEASFNALVEYLDNLLE